MATSEATNANSTVAHRPDKQTLPELNQSTAAQVNWVQVARPPCVSLESSGDPRPTASTVAQGNWVEVAWSTLAVAAMRVTRKQWCAIVAPCGPLESSGDTYPEASMLIVDPTSITWNTKRLCWNNPSNTYGMRHTLFHYPPDANHTAVATQISGDAHPIAIKVTVVSSLSGNEVFEPLQVQADLTVHCLHRQLQWLWCKTHPEPALVRLMVEMNPANLLDPSWRIRHLLQSDIAGRNQKKLVLSITTEPVRLSWEQLCAMPSMRKYQDRGGRGAWCKQQQLRSFCFRNHIRYFDLSERSDLYDWRLLLKTIDENYRRCKKHHDAPSLRMKTIIGRGVISFHFRLLNLLDDNYMYGEHPDDMGERHVFEICCADGIRWHLHFHSSGSFDLMRRSHSARGD